MENNPKQVGGHLLDPRLRPVSVDISQPPEAALRSPPSTCLKPGSPSVPGQVQQLLLIGLIVRQDNMLGFKITGPMVMRV